MFSGFISPYYQENYGNYLQTTKRVPQNQFQEEPSAAHRLLSAGGLGTRQVIGMIDVLPVTHSGATPPIIVVLQVSLWHRRWEPG